MIHRKYQQLISRNINFLSYYPNHWVINLGKQGSNLVWWIMCKQVHKLQGNSINMCLRISFLLPLLWQYFPSTPKASWDVASGVTPMTEHKIVWSQLISRSSLYVGTSQTWTTNVPQPHSRWSRQWCSKIPKILFCFGILQQNKCFGALVAAFRKKALPKPWKKDLLDISWPPPMAYLVP